MPTPAFFTVVAIAEAVGLPLDQLSELAEPAVNRRLASLTGWSC